MSNMELITQQIIENKIYTIRGLQVMLDRDLADLYIVETRVLNQAVKRNQNRFPQGFMFQLTEVEFINWKSQIVMSNSDKMGLRKPPFVFTEQGVAMLSAVLKSDTAVNVSIQIMQAFVAMRNFLSQNASVFQRLEKLEIKQLHTDEKLNQVFKALEAAQPQPDKGIFFDGQIFDAYSFVSDIIKKAKSEIILIDNYIDESVLTILSKRNKNVAATMYTKTISNTLKLDLEKHNAQYPAIEVKTFTNSHDRFFDYRPERALSFGCIIKRFGQKIVCLLTYG